VPCAQLASCLCQVQIGLARVNIEAPVGINSQEFLKSGLRSLDRIDDNVKTFSHLEQSPSEKDIGDIKYLEGEEFHACHPEEGREKQ
jgi:hypothetical protein